MRSLAILAGLGVFGSAFFSDSAPVDFFGGVLGVIGGALAIFNPGCAGFTGGFFTGGPFGGVFGLTMAGGRNSFVGPASETNPRR